MPNSKMQDLITELKFTRKIKKKAILLFRWFTKRCLDCNKPLNSKHNYGEVCTKCYNEFNGATIEDLFKGN